MRLARVNLLPASPGEAGGTSPDDAIYLSDDSVVLVRLHAVALFLIALVQHRGPYHIFVFCVLGGDCIHACAL